MQTKAFNLLEKNHNFEIKHLERYSSIKNFFFKNSKIRISTVGNEFQEMYRFNLANDNYLTVSQKHPILLSSGMMKQAQDITTKNKFIDINNNEVEILSIDKFYQKENVMNFAIETSEPIEHIVFANNIACGDLYWQSSLENMLNRVIIRK